MSEGLRALRRTDGLDYGAPAKCCHYRAGERKEAEDTTAGAVDERVICCMWTSVGVA